MGLFFKSPEEKRMIAEKKEQEREQIRNSPLTSTILKVLDDEFSESGELLQILRTIHGSYVQVIAHYKYVFARFWVRKGETRDVIIINYEQMGYSELNSNMRTELEGIIKRKMDSLSSVEKLYSGASYYRAALKSW